MCYLIKFCSAHSSVYFLLCTLIMFARMLSVCASFTVGLFVIFHVWALQIQLSLEVFNDIILRFFIVLNVYGFFLIFMYIKYLFSPICFRTEMSTKNWEWKLAALNIVGILYFVILSISSLIINLFITMPDAFGYDPQLLFYSRASVVYIFIVLILNYLCLVYFKKHSYVSSAHSALPKFITQEPGGFQTCNRCALFCPPRAKHCPLCQHCVLKRDHHCFFGGCCVGFHNQRYFIVFCFYGIVGALYTTVVTFRYLSKYYANVLSVQVYSYFLPFLLWNWTVGQVQVNIVAMVIYGFFCFFALCGCCYYFAFQCMLLVTGQTSYEYVKGITEYKRPLLVNIASVFGPFWFLNFILPVPCLKSGEDGINWREDLDLKNR